MGFSLPAQSIDYVWQVVQLEVEHELQEELPPNGADVPSLLLENEANDENIRLAL